MGKGEDDLLYFTQRSSIQYPIVPGHEISGLVHAVGGQVSAGCGLAVGERVTVYPWLGCNQCSVCAVGDNNVCLDANSRELGFSKDGGYAEYVKVPHYRCIFKLPDKVPFSMAALLPCSALTAYSAIKKCTQVVERFRRWEREVVVAVIGLGGLGQWALKLLPFCLGKEKLRVVGIDNSSRKLQAMQDSSLMDEAFLFSSENNPKEQACELLERLKDAPQVILDFVNSTETFTLCVELLARTGIHVMVGLHGGLGELQLPLATLSGATRVGNIMGSRTEMGELLEVVCEEDISGPVVKEYRLCEAGQALEDLERGLVDGRAVLNMQ